MKICVLTHTFPRDSRDVAAAFMKGFCDGLVQNGNQVTVVAPFDPKFKRNSDLFKIVLYKYIWPNSLHSLGYSQTMEEDIKLRKRAYLLLPFMLFFSLIVLLKTLKEDKVDLISVHWILPNGLVAYLASKLTGIPYVVTLPGTDVYLAGRFKIFGLIAKMIAQNAVGITSNSSFLLKRILDLGISEKPTMVVSYPADVSQFKPLNNKIAEYRNKLGFSKDEIVILAVGRLVYKKGFEYLIKALPAVLKKHPTVRLLIGGEGDLKQNLQDLVKGLHLQDKVVFAGTIARDEIIYYYNVSDVLVAPSVVDNMGNVDGGPVVCLESMACGKPQVVTNILGMADVIKDGINGFVVPQKDFVSLARAIEKIAASAVLRRKMGEANRKLVVQTLGTESVGRVYTDFFNRVTNRSVANQKSLSYA